ncbi:MAG: hypothetical protein MMC33_009281 [Icmadophila ericetorum]|nr:hypothetical protein [Icmadophila ericetorum]
MSLEKIAAFSPSSSPKQSTKSTKSTSSTNVFAQKTYSYSTRNSTRTKITAGCNNIGPTPSFHFDHLGTPYLVGWQYARRGLSSSQWGLPSYWIAAFYQHPSWQTGSDVTSEYKYNIGHDIYSFGVCLLEIGLWDSFAFYDGPCDKESVLASWYIKELEAWKKYPTNRKKMALRRMTVAQIE